LGGGRRGIADAESVRFRGMMGCAVEAGGMELPARPCWLIIFGVDGVCCPSLSASQRHVGSGPKKILHNAAARHRCRSRIDESVGNESATVERARIYFHRHHSRWLRHHAPRHSHRRTTQICRLPRTTPPTPRLSLPLIWVDSVVVWLTGPADVS